VTTPRSDVDLVITEYGVADLRGASLSQRLKRLSAIAHPHFRDDLLRGEPSITSVIVQPKAAMEASRA
jgi:acyl-CoA hydrolase